ncbi:MAG TPA: hypothetical protein VMV41_00125 [Cellulomonadaceae bacterium]|nr:hypothetical protein [Cellulomonadaceae bacterium]
MTAEDPMSGAVEWAETHKPAAIGGALGLGALLFLLYMRRKNSANGTTGATAAGVGSASLVPYGDATSMGFTGLTGIQDATTGGFSGVSDQLATIAGLLTNLAPAGNATTGGTNTGNTIPTSFADGTTVGGSGATTGAVAQPAAVPAVATPTLVPTAAAPANAGASSYTAPVTTQPQPFMNPATAYQPAYSASIPAAVAQVGGGVPLSDRTNVGGLRALTSFSAADQKIIRSGGTVVGGDGRVFKNVIGKDGTPHATSIGMVGQVI